MVKFIIEIYLTIAIIYLIFNWKKIEKDTKTNREPSFYEGFMHGLAMLGAAICFPYYIFCNKKK